MRAIFLLLMLLGLLQVGAQAQCQIVKRDTFTSSWMQISLCPPASEHREWRVDTYFLERFSQDSTSTCPERVQLTYEQIRSCRVSHVVQQRYLYILERSEPVAAPSVTLQRN